MPLVGLALFVAWIATVAGVRGYLQHRRTGAAAIRLDDPRWSPQWWSRRLATVGFGFGIAAPLAAIAGLGPIPTLDGLQIQVAGIVVAIVGFVVTVASQLAMGDAWRGDVDPDARTELVTSGPFRVVRNPILSGTLVTAWAWCWSCRMPCQWPCW